MSNRGRTRASKAKGCAGAAARSDNPAEEEDPPRRRSLRNRGSTDAANDTLVLDEAAAGSVVAPKRRRSQRSYVLAQIVDNNDESNRFDKSAKQSKAIAAKKPKDTQQARARSTKRSREEEPEVKQETKKSKRSTSAKGKKTEDKKPSKSARGRKRSTSRGSRAKAEKPPRKPCSEFLTETNYGMVRKPFDRSKFTLGIAPHDEAKKGDVNEVADYVTDIFQQLYHAEVRAFVDITINAVLMLILSHCVAFLSLILVGRIASSNVHGGSRGNHAGYESYPYRLVG